MLRQLTRALVWGGVLPLGLAAQTVAITGGTVYPVHGPKIEHGIVVLRNGTIVAVGANVPIPAGATRIDATGKWVTPGLINASTQLGLTEAGGTAFSGGYDDRSAHGTKGVTAAFDAWEGVNPASAFIIPAWQDGITSVLVHPSGTLLSGRSAMLDLAGGTVDAMLIRAPVAMMGTLDPAAGLSQSRGEALAYLRELLSDAKVYATRKQAFENNQSRAFGASRADLEALIPVVTGKLPLALNVNRASDIRAALALAKEFSLKLIVTGGAEAWEVAADLAAAKVPVMVGAMDNIPENFSLLGQRQENAALLRAAGIAVTLVGNGPGDEENFNVRNIRQEAGNAVAYGMSWDDALRAVTLAPAEAFGVADRVGSLQAGREANVVVWSGDPFEFSTRAEQVFIRGALQHGTSRQDELAQRYLHGKPEYFKP